MSSRKPLYQSIPVPKPSQMTITSGFQWLSQRGIHCIICAQLEMAQQFLHRENISDRVVKSIRLKYLLMQKPLVGDEFESQITKKQVVRKIVYYSIIYE